MLIMYWVCSIYTLWYNHIHYCKWIKFCMIISSSHIHSTWRSGYMALDCDNQATFTNSNSKYFIQFRYAYIHTWTSGYNTNCTQKTTGRGRSAVKKGLSDLALPLHVKIQNYWKNFFINVNLNKSRMGDQKMSYAHSNLAQISKQLNDTYGRITLKIGWILIWLKSIRCQTSIHI
jgi:hypothetical protein